MKKRPKASLMLYVVDDATFVRELIFDSLIKKPDSSSVSLQFNVEGEATLAQELLDQLEDLQANLFLIDTDLPDATGWSVVQAINDAHPDAYIVMMCDGLNPKAAEAYADSQSLAFRILEKPFQPSYFWRILDEIGLAMTEEPTPAEEPKRRGLFKKKPMPEVEPEPTPAISHKVKHPVSDWTPPTKLEREPAAPTFVTQTLQQAVETRLVQPMPIPTVAPATTDVPVASVTSPVPPISVAPVHPVITAPVTPVTQAPQATPRKIHPPSFANNQPPAPPRNRKKPENVTPVIEPVLPIPEESFSLADEIEQTTPMPSVEDNLPLGADTSSTVEPLTLLNEPASEEAQIPVLAAPTHPLTEEPRPKPVIILDEIPRDLSPVPKTDASLLVNEGPILESSPQVIDSVVLPQGSHSVESDDLDLLISPDSWVHFEEEDEDEDWIFNTPLAEAQSETPAKPLEPTPVHPPLIPKAPETPVPVLAPSWAEPDLVMPISEPTIESEEVLIDELTLPVAPTVNEWPVFDSLPGFVPPTDPEPETRPGFIPPLEDLNLFLDTDVFVLEEEDEDEEEEALNPLGLDSPAPDVDEDLIPDDYLVETPERPDANFEYPPRPIAYDKGTKPLDVTPARPPAFDAIEKPLIITPLASSRRPKPSVVAPAASPEAPPPAPSKRKGFGKKNK